MHDNPVHVRETGTGSDGTPYPDHVLVLVLVHVTLTPTSNK